MLPRKRQRPNPGGSSLPTTALSREVATPQGTGAASPLAPSPLLRSRRSIAALSASSDDKQVRKSKSWYGSWPRVPSKASASTSVARENILGGTVPSTRTPDLGRFEPRRGDEDASLSSARTASRLPDVPESVTLAGADDGGDKDGATNKDGVTNKDGTANKKDDAANKDGGGSGPATEQPATAQPPATPLRPATSYGWLGWWSRSPETGEGQAESTADAAPSQPGDQPPEPQQPAAGAGEQKPPDTAPAAPASSTTSWFGFWPAYGYGDTSPAAAPPATAPADGTAKKEPEDVVMADAAPAPPPSTTTTTTTTTSSSLPAPKRETAPKAGSTWAFWSRDSPGTGSGPADTAAGEMAVMGEASETHPTPATAGIVSGAPAKEGRKSTWRRGKRARPAEAAAEPAAEGESEARTKAKAATAAATAAEAAAAAATAASTTPPPANLVLPCLHSTYPVEEKASMLQQVADLLLRPAQPPARHPRLSRSPGRIRKAVAIGVHGLVPAPYLRPMVGQPTGTSLRLAGLCAEAIRRWAAAHGSGDCEIERVALEGEGRVGERVDGLWRLLLNWVDALRRADVVLVAAHSQGVPVGVMLLERLLGLGLVAGARVGVCAMAGVALGPFADYRSGLLMGSAAELWEFGDRASAVSRRFEAALAAVLAAGARVTFVGSIDDQLVPLESAVYSPASHPYIYRAVFVDGRQRADSSPDADSSSAGGDFMARLVGLALKLRNLGVSDHGLVRELSAALAGPLYSGDGHSRLYFDAAVYDLAVAHALETAPVDAASAPAPCRLADAGEGGARPAAAAAAAAGANPYVLPWIVRGLLEEPFVRTELRAESRELLRLFDAWRPATKALRDVKYRLEAVRSKL